jgi:hypothetical protein
LRQRLVVRLSGSILYSSNKLGTSVKTLNVVIVG